MSVTYDGGMKNARMTATRDMLKGGTLEIGTAGMSTVLATFKLSGTGGTVIGDIWTMQFVDTKTKASNEGRAVQARIKDTSGTPRLSGLTVGMDKADIVINNTMINKNQPVDLIGDATLQHA